MLEIYEELQLDAKEYSYIRMHSPIALWNIIIVKLIIFYCKFRHRPTKMCWQTLRLCNVFFPQLTIYMFDSAATILAFMMFFCGDANAIAVRQSNCMCVCDNI